MSCSMPGLPIHHQLPESTQTHVHWVGDAIQPSSVVPFSSYPQSFPVSGSFPMSVLFALGGQSIGTFLRGGIRSVLGVHWKHWCWSWNSNTLATWCKELTPWKRLWCWEGLGAGEEGDNWGWDGWLESLTRWTWVWVSSRSWWWTGRPGVLQFMGLQRVGHDWATELNWTELMFTKLNMEWKEIQTLSSSLQKTTISTVSPVLFQRFYSVGVVCSVCVCVCLHIHSFTNVT